MLGCRIIPFALIAIMMLSENHAHPVQTRDLTAEFENTYDAVDKNEEQLNFPNDYEDRSEEARNKKDYEDSPKGGNGEKRGCITHAGSWFC